MSDILVYVNSTENCLQSLHRTPTELSRITVHNFILILALPQCRVHAIPHVSQKKHMVYEARLTIGRWYAVWPGPRASIGWLLAASLLHGPNQNECCSFVKRSATHGITRLVAAVTLLYAIRTLIQPARAAFAPLCRCIEASTPITREVPRIEGR